MLYRKLGKSGLKISAISLGSWQTFGQSVDDETTTACVKEAFDAGINCFDGAEVYGMGKSDEAMGRAFAKLGLPREEIILSGKVFRCGTHDGVKGLSKKRLRDGCDLTLKRFGTDYLDLYLCHRPDPDTPIEEIVVTMNRLIDQGKVLYWGTSEFDPSVLLEMWTFAEANGLDGPIVEQTGYNMLGRDRIENQLEPLFANHGMGSMVYSPLAGGILTGKYNEGVPEDSRIGAKPEEKRSQQLSEERLGKSRKIGTIAKDLGISQAHLALAWNLSNPFVSTCLTGATRPEQIGENVKAVDAVEKITPEMKERIEEVLA